MIRRLPEWMTNDVYSFVEGGPWGTTRHLAALLTNQTETLGRSMALGNSREPPAFTFLSRNTQEGEMLSGLAARDKAAPLADASGLLSSTPQAMLIFSRAKASLTATARSLRTWAQS